eukprot:TRINITY_DN5124_c0_g1_i2.p1 TRINITY_DN5124_c0_g1~~TRINITY_DN5124_c0_g1_i2.p1  ORF type:complete len:2106 (+),score=315.53 TRINITY_DN5124_c0_g1_i2:53-6370(+)
MTWAWHLLHLFHDNSPNPKWAALTLLIQSLQLFAFPVNPVVHWANPLRGLQCVGFALHVPAWNEFCGNKHPVVGATAVFWVYCFILIWFVACALVSAVGRVEQTQLLAALLPGRQLINAISGVLFIPIFSGLLQFPQCSDDSHACSSWYFLLAIPLAVLVAAIRLIYNVFLFSDSTTSALGCTTGRFDALHTVCLIAIMVITSAQGYGSTGSLVSCALLHLFLCPILWFFQPNFSTSTSAGRLWTLLATALLSFFALPVDGAQLSQTSQVVVSSFALVIAILCAPVAYFLTHLRFNPCKNVKTFEPFPRTVAFPRGLTASGSELQEQAELPSVDISESTQTLPFVFRLTNLPVSLHSVLPFSLRNGFPYLCGSVRTVRCAAEAELATRFARLCDFNGVSSEVPEIVFPFSVAIFQRALTKWPQSDLLYQQYASHLCNIGATHLAWGTLRRLCSHHAPHFYPDVQYRLYFMQQQTAPRLGLGDQRAARSKKALLNMHRLLLAHMRKFWEALMLDTLDVQLLSTIAQALYTKRNEALSKWHELFTSSSVNTALLVQWAKFAEEILLDKNLADEAFAEARDNLNHAQGGSQSRSGSRRRSGSGSERRSDFLVGEMRRQQLQTIGRGTKDGTYIGTLGQNAIVVFLCIAILVALSSAYYLHSGRLVEHTLDQLTTAGELQVAIQKCGNLAQLLSLGAASLANSTAALKSLRKAAQSVAALQASLLTGNRMLPDRSAVYEHTLPTVRFPVVATSVSQPPSGSGVSSSLVVTSPVAMPGGVDVESMITLYEKFGAKCEALAALPDPHGYEYSTDAEVLFLRENTIGIGLHLANTTTRQLLSDVRNYTTKHTYLQAIVLAMAFLVTLGVLTAFQYAMKRIALDNSIALHLFSLIPFAEVDKLHRAVVQNISQVDAWAAQLEERHSVDTGNGAGSAMELLDTDEDDGRIFSPPSRPPPLIAMKKNSGFKPTELLVASSASPEPAELPAVVPPPLDAPENQVRELRSIPSIIRNRSRSPSPFASGSIEDKQSPPHSATRQAEPVSAVRVQIAVPSETDDQKLRSAQSFVFGSGQAPEAAAESESNSSGKQQDRRETVAAAIYSKASQMKNVIVLVTVLIIEFAVAAATLFLILDLYLGRSDLDTALRSYEEGLVLAARARNHSEFLTGMSRKFSQFGDDDSYATYWATFYSGDSEYFYTRLLQLGSSEEEQAVFAEFRRRSAALNLIEQVSMQMTVLALGRDLAKYPEVANISWAPSGSSFNWEKLRPHAGPPSSNWPSTRDVTGLHPSTWQNDTSLTAKVKHDLARAVLFDDEYDDRMYYALSPLVRFTALLEARSQAAVDTRVAEKAGRFAACIGLYIIYALCHVALAAAVKLAAFIRRGWAVRVAVMLTSLLVVGALVIMGLRFQTLSHTVDAFEWKRDARAWALKARNNSDFLTERARQFVQFGDPRGYIEYWNLIHNGYRQYVVAQQKALGVTQQELDYVSTSIAQSNALVATETIAMVLTVWAYGLDATLFSDVMGFEWNAQNESNYQWQLAFFADRHLAYSNTTFDKQLPAEQKKLIARSIMYDEKYVYDKSLIMDPLGAFVSSMDTRAEKRLAKYLDRENAFNIAALVCAAFFMVISVALLLMLVVYVLDWVGYSEYRMEMARVTFDRSRYVIGLAMLLVSVVGAVVFHLQHFGNIAFAPKEIEMALQRQQLVALSVTRAGLLRTALSGVMDMPCRLIREVAAALSSTSARLQDGSLRPPRGGDFFSRHASQASVFDAQGLAKNYYSWVQSLVALADAAAPLPSFFSTAYTNMDTVLSLLNISDQHLLDDARKSILTGRAVAIVILIAIIAEVALVYRFIFRPMIFRLYDVEEGTKAMLRLISQDVRESVPAIREYLDSGELNASASVREALVKSEKLISNILPPAIARRLKAGEYPIADPYKNVTLLFSDLCGFTRVSSGMKPQQVVRMLNELFTAYDTLVEEYNLEKIKTIGDAYFLAGNLTKPLQNGALVVVEMAIRMFQAIRSHPSGLNQRVGINTGDVVAGVIGSSIVAFDVWGDAVNVASRMESTGEPGTIQVSEATYRCIRHRYPSATPRPVQVKGKGTMQAYVIDWQQGITAPQEDSS